MTAQARLTQTASVRADNDLTSIAEEVERLTAELRDNTLNIRMLPIATTFGRFKRLIRDLSQELGKEIEMTTEGGETELDKTVIERLNDPLVHLIRNCIDHGIEPPDVRSLDGQAADRDDPPFRRPLRQPRDHTDKGRRKRARQRRHTGEGGRERACCLPARSRPTGKYSASSLRRGFRPQRK